jgi:hypothetical protein
MPGREELLEAFRKAKDSPADMIRFGSLIEDLECYVDNTPYFKEGKLIGRRGGIRRYLEREIPELYAHYKTVMKYKALSKKFRQAVGVADPVPAASLLPEKKEKERSRDDENSVRNEIAWGPGDEVELQGAKVAKAIHTKETPTRNIPTKEVIAREMSTRDAPAKEVTARKMPTSNAPTKGITAGEMFAREILEACEGSAVSLAAQLELRINPNYTPPIRTIRTLGDASSSRTLKGSSSLRISSSF